MRSDFCCARRADCSSCYRCMTRKTVQLGWGMLQAIFGEIQRHPHEKHTFLYHRQHSRRINVYLNLVSFLRHTQTTMISASFRPSPWQRAMRCARLLGCFFKLECLVQARNYLGSSCSSSRPRACKLCGMAHRQQPLPELI